MTAKELERMIAERGGNASALDQVTRRLRDAMKVSTGGRGFNAPALSVAEAAWILIAYAAAEKATDAARAVLDFSNYERPNYFHEAGIFLCNDFGTAMQEILQIERMPTLIEEIRFARNAGLVTIVLKNGERVSYCQPGRDLAEAEALCSRSFVSAGILPGGLLTDVCERLGADRGEQVG